MRGFSKTLAVVLTAWVAQTSHAYDFNELRSTIESRDLRSIDQVLPALPKEFRENFALMYRSRSLQGAHPNSPRAILYSGDGSMIVSFNADASLRGSDRLEIMIFDPKLAHFDFKSIEFTSGKPFFNETPQNCFGCHGSHASDLRPAWDPGLVWRGAYGSHDDSFALNDESVRAEAKAYADFVTDAPSRESYRHLDFKYKIGEGDRSLVESHPNLRLGLILMRQQAKRVARLLDEAAPEKTRATLRRLARCEPVATPATFRQKVEANLVRFLTPIFGDHFVKEFLTNEAPDLTDAMSMGEEIGVSSNDWAITVEARTFAAFDQSVPFVSLVKAELLKRLANSDRSLQPFLKLNSLKQTALGFVDSPGLRDIDSIAQPLSSDVDLCNKL